MEAAIAMADGGVFPSDLGIGQADGAGRSAADAELSGTDGVTGTQELSAYDDEFGFHGRSVS
jgi:hypothetical protein